MKNSVAFDRILRSALNNALVTGLLCFSVLCFSVLGLSIQPAAANVVETDEFSSELARLRYLDLIDELRCPKCQNQNLADSNAAIAVDLRKEVRRLIEEGSSDMEITDYLVARYGDFVRYRPPLKSTTWLLWGAPGLLILLGLLAVLMTRRQRRPQATGNAPLTDEEQQQLQQLLASQPLKNQPEQLSSVHNPLQHSPSQYKPSQYKPSQHQSESGESSND